MDPYVSASTLTTVATDSEETPPDVWESLAQAVSRLFDRECEVTDGFFLPAGTVATLKSFRANGTRHVQLLPYIADSITALTVDGDDRFNDDTYHESEGYLVFDKEIEDGIIVVVTAKWGFPAIPADISYACIEQGLFMWRRKDLAFTDLSGVSSAAVAAQFSPTFKAIAERYHGLYAQNSYFA